MVEYDSWTITSWFGDQLIQRLNILKPGRILECGSGVSTYLVGDWIKKQKFNIDFMSLEHLKDYATKTREMCQGLPVNVVYAPIKDRFYNIRLSPGIDFVLIDGPPGHIGRDNTFPSLWPYLSKDFEVWVDDASRPAESKALAQWKKDYNINIEIYENERGLAIINP